MGFHPIDLGVQAEVVEECAWGRGDPSAVTYERVAMGSYAGGWWVQKSGRSGTKSWMVRDQRAACDTLDRWIRAGGWRRLAIDDQVSRSSVNAEP